VGMTKPVWSVDMQLTGGKVGVNLTKDTRKNPEWKKWVGTNLKCLLCKDKSLTSKAGVGGLEQRGGVAHIYGGEFWKIVAEFWLRAKQKPKECLAPWFDRVKLFCW